MKGISGPGSRLPATPSGFRVCQRLFIRITSLRAFAYLRIREGAYTPGLRSTIAKAVCCLCIPRPPRKLPRRSFPFCRPAEEDRNARRHHRILIVIPWVCKHRNLILIPWVCNKKYSTKTSVLRKTWCGDSDEFQQ